MDHVDDLTPGSGRRTPPRARLRTDAPELSLDGDWDFRWAAGGEPDGPWETLPVPSHWVLHGDGRYGRPWYTNVQFPFPIDPPHVPDENPMGEYRRTFAHPGWDVARVLLRVDGVESVYRVVLNGVEVGVGKGSRLVQEFDVTELLVPGRNELVVRVHQWSSMSYVEDQDQWWLPGIFRDVTLLGRPRGGLDDVWLRTGYGRRAAGTVDPEITGALPRHGRDPGAGRRAAVRLRRGRDGVRRRERRAVDGRDAAPLRRHREQPGRDRDAAAGLPHGGDRRRAVPVNGRPVTFRGVNRHETHPERGRVFDEAHARADLLPMKRHNVNAIRTSHYPPHHRVLELADELGFWVDRLSATWRPTASRPSAGGATRATTRRGRPCTSTASRARSSATRTTRAS